MEKSQPMKFAHHHYQHNSENYLLKWSWGTAAACPKVLTMPQPQTVFRLSHLASCHTCHSTPKKAFRKLRWRRVKCLTATSTLLLLLLVRL